MIEANAREAGVGVIFEDDFGLVEIFTKCAWIKVLNVVFIGEFTDFLFTEFSRIKNITKNECKSDCESGGAH